MNKSQNVNFEKQLQKGLANPENRTCPGKCEVLTTHESRIDAKESSLYVGTNRMYVPTVMC